MVRGPLPPTPSREGRGRIFSHFIHFSHFIQQQLLVG